MGDQVESLNRGTMRGFAVEARSTFLRPEQFRGMILDERWQRVPWEIRATGHYDKILEMVGLADYASAESFRWRLHSDCLFSACIETRIVEFEVAYSFEAKRLAEHKPLGMRETARPSPLETK